MRKDNRRPRASARPLDKSQQREMRKRVAGSGVFLGLRNNEAAPLENLLIGTAECLREFFYSNGYTITRSEWKSKKLHPVFEKFAGWVYAFYDENDVPLYVGETGRTLPKRIKEHMKKQAWRSIWAKVKVLPCPDQAERKVFEALIGLAGGYLANKAQPSGGDNFLDDTILSLIYLGDENNPLPWFPNDMILCHIKHVRSDLKNIPSK